MVAGGTSTIVMLIMGVPFPLALGLVVAILDLIPLAGATLAGLMLATVGFLTSVQAGVVLLVFFILYQQVENHVLQPLVYGRTVQLSPLVVLISILIGTEVAGVLGALGAIPIAGTLQILLLDWLDHRRRRERDDRLAAVAPDHVEPASAGRGPSGRAPPATGRRRARRTPAARRPPGPACPSRPRAAPPARAAARRRPRGGCPPW